MKILLIILILCFSKNCFGQISNYQQLIDAATAKNVLFVQRIPLIEFELKLSDTLYYQRELLLGAKSKFKLDSKMISEIINNSKSADSTYWNDNELPKFIIVSSRQEYLRLKDIIKKFNLTDKDEIKKYRKIVDQYNQTEPVGFRPVYAFSKPIFDNSKMFAIVCYDKGHSGPGCRGQITLFQFVENEWRPIGNIYNCTY